MAGARINRSKAGASAHAKYRAERTAWQRSSREFKLFHRILLVSATLLCLYALIAPSHTSWFAWKSWAIGLATGSVLTLVVFVRNFAPANIETWETGAYAEESTAGALKKLEPVGWFAIHDLLREEGREENIDHVVVGPGGVFVLDTKWRSSRVTATDISVYENGYPKEHLKISTRKLGAQLQQRLAAHGLPVSRVHPVVVYWAEFEQKTAALNGVTIVHGDSLGDWLLSQERTLTNDQVSAAHAFISAMPLATESRLHSA